MEFVHRLGWLMAVMAGLMGCRSLPTIDSEPEESPASTTQKLPDSPASSPMPSPSVQEPDPGAILNAVHRQVQPLGLCQFSFDRGASKEFSEVYAVGDSQYLVQMLCFMAAYQGNYEFVRVEAAGPEFNVFPLDLELAGYPTFDGDRLVLSNTYKFTGAGVCVEETEHQWDGTQLQLLKSQ